MQQELSALFGSLGWMLAAGAAFWLARAALVILLRKRVTPDLAPRIGDLSRSDGASLLLALLGHKAPPIETMGTLRLRPTLGLRLGWWAGALTLAVVHNRMEAPPLGPETLILLLVLGMALQTSLYEISFDRQTVTLPRWWFGRTTHRWADLLAIGQRDRWYVTFDFHKGPRVYVQRYIVGYDRLVEAARKALRES